MSAHLVNAAFLILAKGGETHDGSGVLLAIFIVLFIIWILGKDN